MMPWGISQGVLQAAIVIMIATVINSAARIGSPEDLDALSKQLGVDVDAELDI